MKGALLKNDFFGCLDREKLDLLDVGLDRQYFGNSQKSLFDAVEGRRVANGGKGVFSSKFRCTGSTHIHKPYVHTCIHVYTHTIQPHTNTHKIPLVEF